MKLKVIHEVGIVKITEECCVQGWNSNGNSWDWPAYLLAGSVWKYAKKMVDEDENGKPHTFWIAGSWVSARHCETTAA